MATKTFKIGLSNDEKTAMAQSIYEQVEAMLFEEYDSSETYNTGDYTVYSNTLYRCKEDNVTGAWNSAKWEQATLQDLVDDVNGAVASVTGKANIVDLENGTLVVSKALTAKNLEPVTPESGSTQVTPFINQGTATNNNDANAEVDTGTLGQHLEKQGSVVCKNQQARALNTTHYALYDASGSISDNVATFTATAQYGRLSLLTDYNIVASVGVYWVSCWIKLTTATNLIRLRFQSVGDVFTQSQTGWQQVTGYFTVSTAGTYSINIADTRESGWDEIQVKNIQVINLTQWFNGTDYIPSDLSTYPEHFSWYHNFGDYIPYNTGELVPANGRYLVNGEQNILNPDGTYYEVIPNKGYLYIHNSGTATTISYYDKDKNLIDSESVSSAVNNDGYNSASFTTPANCAYISSSIKTNAMISLYYGANDDYSYKAYQAPHVYDTGDELLLAIGSAVNSNGDRVGTFDTKSPDGTITRNIDSVDLGTLDWNAANENGWVSSRGASLNAKAYGTTETAHIICSKYSVGSPDYTYTHDEYCSLTGTSDPTKQAIAVRSSAFIGKTGSQIKSALNGVIVYYELKSPKTEQGTPFSENMDINDMGAMTWYSDYANGTLVSVPQGCKIFYTAWMAGFIDSLGQREDIDWAAEKIVSQEQLDFKELDVSYIGVVSTTTIATNFYKNEIAITGGLINAKYVSALMSNGNLYPMAKTSNSLVVFNGIDFENANITVSKIYYKD